MVRCVCACQCVRAHPVFDGESSFVLRSFRGRRLGRLFRRQLILVYALCNTKHVTNNHRGYIHSKRQQSHVSHTTTDGFSKEGAKAHCNVGFRCYCKGHLSSSISWLFQIGGFSSKERNGDFPFAAKCKGGKSRAKSSCFSAQNAQPRHGVYSQNHQHIKIHRNTLQYTEKLHETPGY